MQLSLRGPWAAYEQRHQKDQQYAKELEEQVEHLRNDVARITSLFDGVAAQLAREKADLQNERSSRTKLAAALQDLQAYQRQQYEELSKSRCSVQLQLTELRTNFTNRQERLQSEVAALHSENQRLRDELAAFTQSRRSATLSLEAAMGALNLSKDNAATFLRELERVKEAAEETAAQNAQLRSENTTLVKQRDSAKQHAQVLVGEHTRLLEQCQALRPKAAEFDRLQQRATDRRARAVIRAAVAKADAAAPVPSRREVLREAQNIRQGWV